MQVNHIVIDGEKCTDETLVIPEGVTEICDAAFMVNLKIKEVILPESLQTIGASAFWQCHSLEKVEIPDSVTRIDKGHFMTARRCVRSHFPPVSPLFRRMCLPIVSVWKRSRSRDS